LLRRHFVRHEPPRNDVALVPLRPIDRPIAPPERLAPLTFQKRAARTNKVIDASLSLDHDDYP
jgi:hypothetical protein